MNKNPKFHDSQSCSRAFDATSAIRVYVAATAEQMLPVKVLEYSIRKHTSQPVQVIAMHAAGIDIPCPRARANLPRTPFSFQRFLIPALAGYHGRAIYLDSDMQVMSDIQELWQLDMAENGLLSAGSVQSGRRLPQYSVMLLDCNRLSWDITDIVDSLDAGKFSYEDLMYRMCIVDRQGAYIPSEWNSLERYIAGKTKLVHYTDMHTQPWIYSGHPLGKIWVRDLIEAIDQGVISLDFVADHVRQGWVRPSLVYQIENRCEDSSLLPPQALALDKNFSPPYVELARFSSRVWLRRAHWRIRMRQVLLYASAGFLTWKRIKSRISP